MSANIKFVLNLKSAIFQYGYQHGTFKFFVTLKSAIFIYGYQLGIFKFFLTQVRHFLIWLTARYF